MLNPLIHFYKIWKAHPTRKRNSKLIWGPDQQEAFETLQRLCTEAPILAYADFKTPFILHTDASSEGLGAVLYQYQDNQRRVMHMPQGVCLQVKGIIQHTNWNSLP